jgi:CubicO group peptidase (beta-lactamase class C family)
MHHPWRFNGFDGSFGYVKGKICSLATAYAYGLRWTSDCAGRVNIAHSGGLPGFGSQWRIMPDYGIGVVAFANRTYAGFGDANLRILDTIITIAGLKPRALPPSIILKKRKEELVKLLPDWNNAEQSGIFAENFFADYPIDSLRKEARQIFKAAGEIVSVKEMQAENQLRGSFILDGQRQDILIYFTLSPENPALIQEYKIELIPGK